MTQDKKTKLNDKQKMIINIVITVVQILIVLICITASIIILVNPASTTIGKTSTSLLPVLTGSMDGKKTNSFKEGDLIISKKPDNKKWNAAELEVDAIITFEDFSTRGKYITHRIIEVQPAGSTVAYVTKGDANERADDHLVYPDKVLGIYKSHIKGVGKSILWLQEPKNFLIVIVLPLALLFIYNILMFVMTIMRSRMERQAQMQTGEAVSEEELKQKIIEEFLAKQKGEEQGANEVETKVLKDEEPVAQEEAKVVEEVKEEKVTETGALKPVDNSYTVAELKGIAQERGVELLSTDRKADIIEKINKNL